MLEELEKCFEEDAKAISLRTREQLKRSSAYFDRMINEMGGRGAAKALLAGELQDGFTDVAILSGHPELTIESLVVLPKYAQLFEPHEIREARDRLGK